MKLLVALAAGYVLGIRTGGDDVDEIVKSLRALKDSEEFHELMSSVRSHAGHTLRELASMVERPAGPMDPAANGEVPSTHDLVERVRSLAGLR